MMPAITQSRFQTFGHRPLDASPSCRKFDSPAQQQLQILLCPVGGNPAAAAATAAAAGITAAGTAAGTAAAATAAANGAAEQSAGPSLEGLGLATPPAKPAHVATGDASADGAVSGIADDRMGSGAAGGLSDQALPAAVAALVLEHALQPARVQVNSWHTQAAVMLCCAYAVLFLCCPVSTWPLLHLFVQPRRRILCILGPCRRPGKAVRAAPAVHHSIPIIVHQPDPAAGAAVCAGKKGATGRLGCRVAGRLASARGDATRRAAAADGGRAGQRSQRYEQLMSSYWRRLLVKDVRQIRLYTASDIV